MARHGLTYAGRQNMVELAKKKEEQTRGEREAYEKAIKFIEDTKPV